MAVMGMAEVPLLVFFWVLLGSTTPEEHQKEHQKNPEGEAPPRALSYTFMELAGGSTVELEIRKKARSWS